MLTAELRCFVQVTILNVVWCSQRTDAPWCAHFSTDICCVIQEGVITVEKCAHRGASALREHHTLSLGQNMDKTSQHPYGQKDMYNIQSVHSKERRGETVTFVSYLKKSTH